MRDGLLLTDLGAEVEGYSADVTRTYPADGTFSADVPSDRTYVIEVVAFDSSPIRYVKMQPARYRSRIENEKE